MEHPPQRRCRLLRVRRCNLPDQSRLQRGPQRYCLPDYVRIAQLIYAFDRLHLSETTPP